MYASTGLIRVITRKRSVFNTVSFLLIQNYSPHNHLINGEVMAEMLILILSRSASLPE